MPPTYIDLQGKSLSAARIVAKTTPHGAHRMATVIYSVTWFEPPPGGSPGPGMDTHRGQPPRDTAGPFTHSSVVLT